MPGISQSRRDQICPHSARYEQAIPLFPAGQVKDLIRRQAPRQDMLDLMAATSPLGFFIFFTDDVEPTVRLAGDQGKPAILLYAPLHTVFRQNPAGPAYFSQLS